MKFNVIIGNPPYQELIGGGGVGKGTAIPLYNYFMEKAKGLNPDYISMIIPAKWYTNGRGLDTFRSEMINDKRLVKLIDYYDSGECFPDVYIAGGVCYFLWDRQADGLCEVTNHFNNQTMVRTRELNTKGVMIRNNKSLDIVSKVLKVEWEFMNDMVQPVSLFGLNTNEELMDSGDVKVMSSRGMGYYDKHKLRDGIGIIDKYKVIISAASSDFAGQPDEDGKRGIIGRLEILPPGTVCTSSYIVVGSRDSIECCNNIISYIKCYFTRFLIMQICNSQHISRESFKFVPVQDFNKPWTDEELYEKYNITDDEQEFIKSLIREH